MSVNVKNKWEEFAPVVRKVKAAKAEKEASERIENLRTVARNATLAFLEKAPPRSHGRVLIDSDDGGSGIYLAYRRIEREYGLFVEYPNGIVVALDKAKDKSLIDGCMNLRRLYDEVCTNAERDAERAESAIVEALGFVEQMSGSSTSR